MKKYPPRRRRRCCVFLSPKTRPFVDRKQGQPGKEKAQPIRTQKTHEEQYEQAGTDRERADDEGEDNGRHDAFRTGGQEIGDSASSNDSKEIGLSITCPRVPV